MNFQGNKYIRDIFGLNLIPLITYISFVYWKTTNSKKDLMWFMVMMGATFLMLLYNVEKAPIVRFFIGFLFLRVLMGKGVSLKLMIGLGIGILGVLVIMYIYIMGKDLSILFSLYKAGILSRVIISQIAGMFVYLDIFPAQSDFIGLKGISILSQIFNWEVSEGSSRIAMNIFYAEGIESGVAGFMSTLFVGEAWANFGIFGLLISPLYVGGIIQTFNLLILKSKKTHVFLGLYAYLALSWPINSVFSKFYYNPTLMAIMFIFILIIIVGYILRESNKGEIKILNERF